MVQVIDTRLGQVAVVRHIGHARLGMTPGTHGWVDGGKEDVGGRRGVSVHIVGRGLSAAELADAEDVDVVGRKGP